MKDWNKIKFDNVEKKLHKNDLEDSKLQTLSHKPEGRSDYE